MGTDQPPWGSCFVTPGTTEPAEIELRQLTATEFALSSALEYVGPTDADVPDRCVDAARLPRTDLASVPIAFRWFVSRYGIHTPAVLLHDWLVDLPPRANRVEADQLLLDSLRCVGVPLVRRRLMWAAVVFGTRWGAGGLQRAGVAAWAVLTLLGLTSLVLGLIWWEPFVVLGALVAPFPFGLLWGTKQYSAGVWGAVSAPWLVPPTVAGGVGYLVYLAIEWFVGLFRPSEPPPMRYRNF